MNDIIDALLVESIMWRMIDTNVNKLEILNQYIIAKDYKTIGITTRRGAGKSSWIKKFVDETNEQIFVITRDYSLVRYIYSLKDKNKYALAYLYQHSTTTIADLDKYCLGRSDKPKFIIVDDCKMFEAHLDALYRMTNSSDILQTYILLGS